MNSLTLFPLKVALYFEISKRFIKCKTSAYTELLPILPQRKITIWSQKHERNDSNMENCSTTCLSSVVEPKMYFFFLDFGFSRAIWLQQLIPNPLTI